MQETQSFIHFEFASMLASCGSIIVKDIIGVFFDDNYTFLESVEQLLVAHSQHNNLNNRHAELHHHQVHEEQIQRVKDAREEEIHHKRGHLIIVVDHSHYIYGHQSKKTADQTRGKVIVTKPEVNNTHELLEHCLKRQFDIDWQKCFSRLKHEFKVEHGLC